MTVVGRRAEIRTQIFDLEDRCPFLLDDTPANSPWEEPLSLRSEFCNPLTLRNRARQRAVRCTSLGVHPQSLNGSYSFFPAIATPMGFNVCKIRIESPFSSNTSGNRL